MEIFSSKDSLENAPSTRIECNVAKANSKLPVCERGRTSSCGYSFNAHVIAFDSNWKLLERSKRKHPTAEFFLARRGNLNHA